MSSISRFAAVAPPTADVEVSDAEADERLNALTFPNLPEEFWEARPVLCHIRLRPYSATSAEIGIGSAVTGIAASSTGSPLGQALVGRRVGDTIAYRGPEGSCEPRSSRYMPREPRAAADVAAVKDYRFAADPYGQAPPWPSAPTTLDLGRGTQAR